MSEDGPEPGICDHLESLFLIKQEHSGLPAEVGRSSVLKIAAIVERGTGGRAEQAIKGGR